MPFTKISNIVFLIGRLKRNKVTPLGTSFLTKVPGVFGTCAHILNGSDKDLVIVIQENDINGYQDTTKTSNLKLLPVTMDKIDPLRDICTLKAEIPNSSNISLSNTNSLKNGDKVIVFGYPHANTGRTILTQQTTEVGAKILLSNGKVKSKHLVLNIQARPGQSGGPIFKKSDLTLVGIIIGAYVPKSESGISLGGIDPQTLHQTTHAVSAEYLGGILANEY